MFNRMHTRIGSNTFHIDVLPGQHIDQEGAALVLKVVNGKGYAALSEGTAGEVFIGFSTGRGSQSSGMTVKYIDMVVPKGDDEFGNPLEPALQLEGTPVLTGFNIKIGADAQTPSASAAAANAPQLVGNKLIFDAASAGKRVVGIYATTRVGDAALHTPTVDAHDCIGVIASGDIATDVFDVAADFSDTNGNPPALKLGADGKLTTTGAGTDVSAKLVLLAAPSKETNGFLKVRAL